MIFARLNPRHFSFIFTLIVSGAVLPISYLRAETLDEWVTSENPTATRKLLAALGRNGAVVASPDESTPGQNYYFHWIRDGALTMDVVVTLYANAPNDERRAEYSKLLRSYLAFSRKNQTEPQPSGFTGLGEPKFLVSGAVFPNTWGRPQNDGPALHSITLCHWAQLLLDENDNDPVVQNEVKPVLLDDLAYVRQHWPDKCTDLWEEVRGKHFYTQMVQRRALLDGAKLLDRVGESSFANDCRGQLPPLETSLAQYFDANKNYILATLDAAGDGHGKTSQLDVAVVLATLRGETADQPFFSPSDDRVLATVAAVRQAFVAKFPINQRTTDDDGRPMEPAIGRYPEDKYNGANDTEGNPWFLTTSAYAEHAYRTRKLYVDTGSIDVTDRNLSFLTHALNAGGSSTVLTTGETIHASDPRFSAINGGLTVVGDGYLRRVRSSAAADGSLSEQFKGTTGSMTGAVDLTWSYAALLTAIGHR
jgi:glucoamylase